MASNKFICIHGHFYQPPRENAWLEVIEHQDSAHPFHDWNERINAECYAPNAASRILDTDDMITYIVNNYAKISFNIGPTLLLWLEEHDPVTYASILEADRVSQAHFSGHGNAVAQVYGHLIMPLANERDKETQVVWGIRDFEYRFQRKPEGIWLAETAVDIATLEVLAENDIKYTILAPRQAKKSRKIGTEVWEDLSWEKVDPRRPYICHLPSGKSMALFFYDGRVAKDVAFNRLLNSGKSFSQRLIDALDTNDTPQLSHIATDGESYGHHHKHGDMALADCLYQIDENDDFRLTNYGEYLEKFPPEYEVEIFENSSWSCVHGVERWRSNCGCNAGGGYGKWNQKWRKDLRHALDWLRDKIIPIFEEEAGKLLKDPWAARNDFIDVVLRRNDEAVQAFINKHALNAHARRKKTKILRLMEMQRQSMQQYTSCGWFFDEVSGLETTQILKYACRAIYYAWQVSGIDLEPAFLQELAKAKSNIPDHGDGATIYKKFIEPAKISLERVGMHYAIASLFTFEPEEMDLFNYRASSQVYDLIHAGRQKLAVGQTVVKSKITHSEKHFSFAVLHLGQHHIIGNISLDMTKERFDAMHNAIKAAFSKSNLAQVFSIMQDFFGPEKFSLNQLFKDEKRKIVENIIAQNSKETEDELRDIYHNSYQLMNALHDEDLPITNQYKTIVQYVLNLDLQKFFREKLLHFKELKRIVSEFKKWDIAIFDQQAIELVAKKSIYASLKRLEEKPYKTKHIVLLNKIFDSLKQLEVHFVAWKSQNLYFDIVHQNSAALQTAKEDPNWVLAFTQLGEHLGVKVNF